VENVAKNYLRLSRKKAQESSKNIEVLLKTYFSTVNLLPLEKVSMTLL
jgi:hypothetical protein